MLQSILFVFSKIFAGLLIALASIFTILPTAVPPATTSTQEAPTSPSTTTIVAVPTPSPATTSVPTTTVPKKTSASSLPAATPAPVLPKTAIVTPEPPQQQSLQPAGDLNTNVRQALVNVLCTTKGGGLMKPISGSGVIIDPHGIVLTNAHIAQFFLLRDYPYKDNIECILRTGSPAQATYTATILYFPYLWAQENAEKIIQENPTGTGENDFALLYITGRTNPSASLPDTFPYVEPYIGESVETGEPVLLAGYPAGFLAGATIQTNLYITSALTTIGQIFTFKDGGGADLFSIGGTVLSQKGSSGGAVVRQDNGQLAGLIVTASTADTTAQRDLRAITLRHVNESMKVYVGVSLSSYITGDVRTKAAAFNVNTVPTLAKFFIDVLNR